MNHSTFSRSHWWNWIPTPNKEEEETKMIECRIQSTANQSKNNIIFGCWNSRTWLCSANEKADEMNWMEWDEHWTDTIKTLNSKKCLCMRDSHCEYLLFTEDFTDKSAKDAQKNAFFIAARLSNWKNHALNPWNASYMNAHFSIKMMDATTNPSS